MWRGADLPPRKAGLSNMGGRGDGAPPWDPCPPINLMVPQYSLTFGMFRVILYPYIHLFSQIIQIAYILPNKGYNSCFYPHLYTFFAYLRHLQIVVTNHAPIPPMCPHAKICTDNPVSDRVKTDRVITNEEIMNYVCAMKV